MPRREFAAVPCPYPWTQCSGCGRKNYGRHKTHTPGRSNLFAKPIELWDVMLGKQVITRLCSPCLDGLAAAVAAPEDEL